MANDINEKTKPQISPQYIRVEGNELIINATISGASCNGQSYTKNQLSDIKKDIHCNDLSTIYFKDVSFHRTIKPVKVHKDPSVGNSVKINKDGSVNASVLLDKNYKIEVETGGSHMTCTLHNMVVNERLFPNATVKVQIPGLTFKAGINFDDIADKVDDTTVFAGANSDI